ncbi:hypothetical protein T07_8616 [Trichinella nelsoni]|uniref:Uncharacterized protein n=1 Tax=Trichinella nelsoni TaxID=6336 RepID=A0A0V0RCQ4_9BILA|nr:hypothetical protein T07_8616 [Trichinella nelsoni]
MDKVHQSAPGSSSTRERTDLVTRPRAVWSLADRAIPSREQNSSTILPNGARLRGMFGSMINTTSPIRGFSCTLRHFPRDESVTRYSRFQRVHRWSTSFLWYRHLRCNRDKTRLSPCTCLPSQSLSGSDESSRPIRK